MTVSARTPSIAEERRRLDDLVTRRFERSTAIPSRFFDEQAGAISRACRAMAERFQRGGRLLVFGEGAEATDAQHVAVEFVHPVIVGKRALPALALTADVATLTGIDREATEPSSFAGIIGLLGREPDIAMGISRSRPGAAVLAGLSRARQLGLLSIALSGGEEDADSMSTGDIVFTVPSTDPLVVQEVHETLYHVLWELVHVFLDHHGSA